MEGKKMTNSKKNHSNKSKKTRKNNHQDQTLRHNKKQGNSTDDLANNVKENVDQETIVDETSITETPSEETIDVIETVVEGEEATINREEVESSFSSVLDQLRRERGQVPIEEEEKKFQWENGLFEDEDDFTTADLLNDTQQTEEANLTALYEAEPELQKNPNDRESYLEETEQRGKSSKKRKKKNKKIPPATQDSYENQEDIDDHDEVEPKRGRYAQEAEKPKLNKKNIAIVAVLILILGLAFGAYVYKVQVYDPAHVVSEEQDSNYKKLQKFADEYSMASDAEKQEILGMASVYDSLAEQQKESINKYLKEQTGKNYQELVSEAQGIKEKEEAKANPTFDSLLKYVQGYKDLDQAGKDEIQNKVEEYNSLTDYQKERINLAMKAQNGKTFTETVEENKRAIAKKNEKPKEQVQQELAPETATAVVSYQEVLAGLQADRATYAQFLQEEGLPYDDVLQEYDNNIAYYQSLMGQGQ